MVLLRWFVYSLAAGVQKKSSLWCVPRRGVPLVVSDLPILEGGS